MTGRVLLKAMSWAICLALMVGFVSWLAPSWFEDAFGWRLTVIAQAIGIPALWLVGAAANLAIWVLLIAPLALVIWLVSISAKALKSRRKGPVET